MSEERKIVGLDNFAKGLISSTVKGVHLAKIRKLNTAKEMWDTLKAISQGTEEMLENKLSMACNKLNDFKMLQGETIEHMKNRFIDITLEITAIKADKYNQCELNQKVICALPTSWHMCVVLHPNRMDFNKISSE